MTRLVVDREELAEIFHSEMPELEHAERLYCIKCNTGFTRDQVHVCRDGVDLVLCCPDRECTGRSIDFSDVPWWRGSR